MVPMAFCSNCGKEMNEGAKFCDSCGSSSQGGSTQLSGLGSSSNRIQVDVYEGVNWWDKYVYVIIGILTIIVIYALGATFIWCDSC